MEAAHEGGFTGPASFCLAIQSANGSAEGSKFQQGSAFADTHRVASRIDSKLLGLLSVQMPGREGDHRRPLAKTPSALELPTCWGCFVFCSRSHLKEVHRCCHWSEDAKTCVESKRKKPMSSRPYQFWTSHGWLKRTDISSMQLNSPS